MPSESSATARALAPLRHTIYRWLWIASLASNMGTWMHNVGAAWLMTSLDSSPLLVALVQTATSLPVFLFGIPAGAIADIFDRRRLLLVTQGWMLLAAAILGAITIFGVATPASLLVLTFMLGIGSAMNGPAWQATVPELVPREELAAAVALNSVQFNIARAIGPALGGLVIAVSNTGSVFLLNAVSFVGVMAVIYWWPGVKTRESTEERVVSAMWAGLRYVRYAPELHSVLIRCGVFVLCGSALWAMLPVVAKQELGSSATGYGVLLGCLGTGSVIGAFALGRLQASYDFDTMAIGGTVLFAAATCALAFLQSFGLLCIAMLFGGFSWLLTMSCFNVASQTALPKWVRARALAIYILVFQGSLALGSWIWGDIASRRGLRVSLVLSCLGLLLGAIATRRFRLSQAGEIDVTPAMQWPEPSVTRMPAPDDGPVLVMIEYRIPSAQALEFTRAMYEVGPIRRRNGAIRWGLFEDAANTGRYVESFLVESWAEHLRQHERLTVSDRAVEERAIAFHTGGEPPPITHWIASDEKENGR